jgi:hypothetical protein
MKLTENASFKTDKYIDLGAWIKIKQEFDTLFETACKNAHNWKTMASSFIVDASRKLKVVYKFEPRAQSMFKTHRMEPSYKFNWFLAVRIHTSARPKRKLSPAQAASTSETVEDKQKSGAAEASSSGSSTSASASSLATASPDPKRRKVENAVGTKTPKTPKRPATTKQPATPKQLKTPKQPKTPKRP